MQDRRDGFSFLTTAAANHNQGLDVPLFAERAAAVAHRGCAVLAGFETSEQASGDVFQSPDYDKALARKSTGDFLQFMLSEFPREEKLYAKNSRAL